MAFPIMAFPIICHGCQRTGSVSRVTAGLQCECGSTDLDIWDGQKTAGQYGTGQSFHTFMTQGRWPEEEDESEHDNGEVKFKNAQEEHNYGAGYDHGHNGAKPQQSDEMYSLGHEHGTRDREHVIKHETWGRDELGNVRIHPGPDGARLKSPVVQGKQAGVAAPGNTGWGKSMPDSHSNWSEYAGPTPGTNPNIGRQNDADGDHQCQICNGTGRTDRFGGGGYEESVCRNCHGTGKVKYSGESHGGTNDAHVPNGSPLGASGPKTGARARVTMPDGTTYLLPLQVSGSHKAEPSEPQQSMSLPKAACVSCGNAHTAVIKDKNDDGWWHCASCGPLANLDKNPSVDPYQPASDFAPDRSMKRKGKIMNRKNQGTGKLMSMTAAIQASNAVSVREALTLARQSLIRFPEGRD